MFLSMFDLEKPPPQVSFDDGIVERVTSFKLLGVAITNDVMERARQYNLC
jgi:hypothetical protein